MVVCAVQHQVGESLPLLSHGFGVPLVTWVLVATTNAVAAIVISVKTTSLKMRYSFLAASFSFESGWMAPLAMPPPSFLRLRFTFLIEAFELSGSTGLTVADIAGGRPAPAPTHSVRQEKHTLNEQVNEGSTSAPACPRLT